MDSQRDDIAKPKRAEAQLRGIVESAMDAIITVDESQRVVMFNPAAERMFGYSQNEAIGASMSLFLPPRFRDAHAQHVRRFGETGVSSRRMGALRVVTGVGRNGEEFPLDASISQHSDGAAKFHGDLARRHRTRRRREGVAPCEGLSCTCSPLRRIRRASRSSTGLHANCTTSSASR